jgi:hypothetical protein
LQRPMDPPPPFPPPACARLAELTWHSVAACPQERAFDFTNQELANLVWAYAKLRHPLRSAVPLLKVVAEEVRARAGAGAVSARQPRAESAQGTHVPPVPADKAWRAERECASHC